MLPKGFFPVLSLAWILLLDMYRAANTLHVQRQITTSVIVLMLSRQPHLQTPLLNSAATASCRRPAVCTSGHMSLSVTGSTDSCMGPQSKYPSGRSIDWTKIIDFRTAA